MDRGVGLTESEKSAGTLVTVTLAVPLTLPLAVLSPCRARRQSSRP